MKRLLAVSLAIFFLVAPAAAQEADEAEDVLDVVFEAGQKAISWFKSLQEEMAPLVSAAEKRQLVHSLEHLRTDLYDLERAKREFVENLERDSLDGPAIRGAVEKLNETLLIARQQFYDVALQLRGEQRRGGLEVEEVLDSGLGLKGEFIWNLERVPPDPESLQRTIDAGKKALEALRLASIELTKLIIRIEEDESREL